MAYDEIQIIKNISHPNIVNIIDSYISEEQYLNIILEFCDGGSLQSKIDKIRNKVLKEKEVAIYFFQICKAVNYLHSKKIIHRDLKAENILIDNQVNLKLADLG